MAKKTIAKKAPVTTNDAMEERLVAFAEQLGMLVGTVQAKTDGWVNREAINKEIARIKGSAAELLEYVNESVTRAARPAGRKQVAASATGQGRGLAAAPGKRHRQPPPQERGSRSMSQPKGTQTAPELVKAVRRGGRG
jgi:hypothetical protein